MFCPECRAEYRPGFSECSDCRVALVSELKPEPKPEPGPTPAEKIKAADAKKETALKKVEDKLKGPDDTTGDKLNKAFEDFDDDDEGW